MINSTQQLVLIILLFVFMWKKRKALKKSLDIQAYTLIEEDEASDALLRENSSSSDSLDLVVNFIPDSVEEYKGH